MPPLHPKEGLNDLAQVASCAVCLLPPAPQHPTPKFHFLERWRGYSQGLQEPAGDQVVEDGGKAVRHAGGLEMLQSGTVSLGPKGRTQQARVTWPENRSGGRSEKPDGENSGRGMEKHKRATGEKRNQTGQRRYQRE